MIKLLLLLSLILGQKSIVFAQILPYVIISIEDSYKVSQHGAKSYYWIIELDSLNSYDFNPSYLFLNFTKQNLDDCCNGIEVDPFLVFPDSKYEVDTFLTNELIKFKDIISNNKKKVLEIKKKWYSGQKLTVSIYATPVFGKFCSSDFHKIGQQRQGYYGKVYMPFSSFEYYHDFWEQDKSKFIINSDLSKIEFDLIDY